MRASGSVRVLMARAALSGVIPSACSCARNLSQVELALAVSEASAARPKVAQSRWCQHGGGETAVFDDDLLVLMSSEVRWLRASSQHQT